MKLDEARHKYKSQRHLVDNLIGMLDIFHDIWMLSKDFYFVKPHHMCWNVLFNSKYGTFNTLNFKLILGQSWTRPGSGSGSGPELDHWDSLVGSLSAVWLSHQSSFLIRKNRSSFTGISLQCKRASFPQPHPSLPTPHPSLPTPVQTDIS